MARLTNILRDDFCREDFETYPIWTWDDSMEFYHPTDENVAHPEEHGVLFIKSNFKAPDGTEFPGFLIGCGSVYAIGLYVGDEEISFNVNMPKFAEESVQKIGRMIGKPDFQLFPLTYESKVTESNGKPIKGVFNIPDVQPRTIESDCSGESPDV